VKKFFAYTLVSNDRLNGRTVNAHASCAGGQEFDSQRPTKSYSALQTILHHFNTSIPYPRVGVTHHNFRKILTSASEEPLPSSPQNVGNGHLPADNVNGFRF